MTLESILPIADLRGFVGAVLDGFDVEGAISEATDLKLIARAFEIAAHDHERVWAERIARRWAAIDKRPKTQLQLALVLATSLQCVEAKEILEALSQLSKTDDHRRVTAVIHAVEGRPDVAFALFETLSGRVMRFHPDPSCIATVQELLDRCHLADASVLLDELCRAYPSHLYLRSLRLRCTSLIGDVDATKEISAADKAVLDAASPADRRTFIATIADAHALLGRTTELFAFVCDNLEVDPANWALYHHAASCARAASLKAEYGSLVAGIPENLQESAEALGVKCRWLLDNGSVGDALQIVERIRPLSAQMFLQAQLWASMYDDDQGRVEEAFEACRKCGVSVLGAAVAFGMHTYYYNCSDAQLRNCLGKLEECLDVAGSNWGYWQIYLKCLVGIGENKKAEAAYRALPEGLARSGPLAVFGMFFDKENDRDAEARSGWSNYLRATRHHCVNAKSSYPKTVRLKFSGAPGAVLLFVTAYNAIEYIDWFLDHYRRLGVDHFFVIDNGSTDGTHERILREPDVSVFHNSESFAKAGFGVFWINHLLQRFGVNHWCFHVDIDEGFVFPGYGAGRTLQELLRYCDAKGFHGVSAIELDMYPERLEEPTSEDPFARSCYFDTDYFSVRSEIAPYVIFQGGLRRRMTGLAVASQKLPLVRVTPDLRYIECNHATTHVPIADVSGALLHYKFVGQMMRRVDDAIAREEHYFGSVIYRRLKRAFTDRSDGSLLSPYSRRYDGPECLLENGLMRRGAF